MRERDVSKLKIGDKITLKHRLGVGTITKIVMTEEVGGILEGRYPMIQFHEEGVGELWCTYRVIKESVLWSLENSTSRTPTAKR